VPLGTWTPDADFDMPTTGEISVMYILLLAGLCLILAGTALMMLRKKKRPFRFNHGPNPKA
jgi:LPXTG-motif cell wall-anchored protein